MVQCMQMRGMIEICLFLQARHGAYCDVTSKCLLPVMLDGGLLFIVRWALDDITDNGMAAAVNCLHRLLVYDAL